MPSMRTPAGKAVWRHAAAAAVAVCGVASAQDGAACATCPNPAPTDMSTLYRDAYTNPGAMASRGVQPYAAAAAPTGQWMNPKRYRWFFGGDYISIYRPQLDKTSLTSVSNDLFWDDPLQRASGALNAAVGAAAVGSRTVGLGSLLQVFPLHFLPQAGLTPVQGTPNDTGFRLNVNETLVPNAARMSTNSFRTNRGLDGYRPMLGIYLPDDNSVELSYSRINQYRPGTLIDNVAGAAFLTRIISNGNDRITPFAAQRWGYLRAPFTLNQGDRTNNDFANFRGEDVRGFAPNNGIGIGQTANFPHFPYNEVPQPQNPIGGPLVGLFPVVAPVPFMRSTDIPRKPTTNDFPGLGSLIFRNGEFATASFRSDLQGADLLYRRNVLTEGQTRWNVQLVGGLRYVQTSEHFNYFWAQLWNFSRTAAAGPVTPLSGNTATPNIPQPPFFVPNDNGVADPIDVRGQAAEDTQVTIDRQITNNVFGPQLGFDARLPFANNLFDLQVMTKGGWMANYADTKLNVFRGDGLVYTSYDKSSVAPSGILEGKLGLGFHPHQKVEFHAGGEYLWLMGVGTALGNLQGDLSRSNRPATNQQQFYLGYYLGGSITF